MPHGLRDFINELEKHNELLRIEVFADPCLEITEITDRVTKSGLGKALLFENNGTSFPLLINSYGSDKRMSLALGIDSLQNISSEFEKLFSRLLNAGGKLDSLSGVLKISGLIPSRSKSKGICQEIVHHDPDLNIFPVLKCWPWDGGKFLTLPMVHTVHPSTGMTNVGMYRMQILDRKTTGMHWQRHKTGANHFAEWKKTGRRMPVTVTLGGDPVYAYAATAPLPENLNEYILAGFLRNKKVRLVKCLTNDLYIPEDVDIVIEGYVDPLEDLVSEGPFGDHTGFYSLADLYPKFHVTCITHCRNAVYPATIVGIPPMEDAWLASASEKIFLSPVRLALQPEILDFHMPDAGTAHNLLIVKIRKSYPGQGMKVLNSLFGAGQMMFSKYMIVVSGDVDIRTYSGLAHHIFKNTDFKRDVFFISGPLDVLDHTSERFSFGGKAGIDATIKLEEEKYENFQHPEKVPGKNNVENSWRGNQHAVKSVTDLSRYEFPLIIVSVDTSAPGYPAGLFSFVDRDYENIRLILLVDQTVETNDLFTVCWQVLANSDPLRDHMWLGSALVIDGTIKAFRKDGFPRKWPNVICSLDETIKEVDRKWASLGIGPMIPSPSEKYKHLAGKGKDFITPADGSDK